MVRKKKADILETWKTRKGAKRQGIIKAGDVHVLIIQSHMTYK